MEGQGLPGREGLLGEVEVDERAGHDCSEEALERGAVLPEAIVEELLHLRPPLQLRQAGQRL